MPHNQEPSRNQHPLDPGRIGVDGLVARFEHAITAGLAESELDDALHRCHVVSAEIQIKRVA